jgi:DNA-binding XRE family transcriptional regulator
MQVPERIDSGNPLILGLSPTMLARPPSVTSKQAIAVRLRQTREALELDQAGICRLTGITPQAWNNYEKAVNRIALEQALMICQKTGVTLDWIYRGEAGALPYKIASKLPGTVPAKGRRA